MSASVSRFSPRSDIPAGLVVSLVALPLCLGIALASGAPLFSGLIAGIIGGIVVGLLSGSHLSVTGPAAGLTSIVLTSITQLGSFEVFLCAVALAGGLQVLLCVLRAGGIVNYIPSAVIRGMLAGIGIIIIMKQLPHALGYDKAAAAHLAGASEVSQWLQAATPGAVVIALAGLLILALWERPFAKKLTLLPGALVAVLAGVGINQAFLQWLPSWAIVKDAHLVRVPVAESLQALVSGLSHPDWSGLTNGAVWVVALTLAVVASIETLLCIEATDKIDPLKRQSPANRELLAQGAGNIISGLLGGLPITSVIVRSSANLNAGAKSKASAIIHGIILLLCVLFIPRLLNYIPLASLAAVLLLTGWKLAKISVFRDMYSRGWLQFLPFIVTIVTMVYTDLLKGVGAGLVLSILFILWQTLKQNFTQTEQSGAKVIRLGQHVHYLHKAGILRALESMGQGQRVVVDASHSNFVDPDVVDALHDFRTGKAAAKGVEVELTGAAFSGPVRSAGH